MVVTILEANVAEERVGELERVYRDMTAEIPPEIVETFLVRGSDEAGVFRIITVWSSREALDRMRAQTAAAGTKPGGVLIFEAVGAAPTLKINEVVVHRHGRSERRTGASAPGGPS
jgi:quinol monooxygenase YgiN